MPQTNYFPDPIKTKENGVNGTVNINGVTHGYSGHIPPRNVMRVYDSPIRKIRPQDYLLLEGSPFQLADDKDSYQRIPIWGFLLHLPEIRSKVNDWSKRTEVAEFYFDTILWNPVDMLIVPKYFNPDLNPTEELRIYGNVTFFSREEIESIKQNSIDALVEGLDGVSREEVALFIEKFHTLRSLLLARTSAYRAVALGTYTLGGTVHLFEGAGHTGETLRFLKRPETVQPYLSRSHEEIRHIYERNEEFQQEVTEAFHNAVGRQKLRPKDRTLVLKQIVDLAMEEYKRQKIPEGTRLARL